MSDKLRAGGEGIEGWRTVSRPVIQAWIGG